MTSIDRQHIEATYAVIRPHVRVTPVVEVHGADFGIPDATVVLKLEHLQHSGSFKARGAFANLLTRKLPAAGVVAASGGNHGAAVAYAAMRLGVPAKIFVPTVSSPAKIQRIRDYRAELVVVGDRYADALAASETWAIESGALPVHAFDQVETMHGHRPNAPRRVRASRHRHSGWGKGASMSSASRELVIRHHDDVWSKGQIDAIDELP